MSVYGRIFHIGEIIVGNIKLIKLRRMAVGMLMLLIPVIGSQIAMASLSSESMFSKEGKKITIIDGENRITVHSNSNDYKQIIFENNITFGKHDSYWTSSNVVNEGSVIVIERAVPVILDVKGKQKKVYTTDKTVQGVLNTQGFDWKTMTALEDDMEMVRAGMVIHVVPYTTKIVTVEQDGDVVYDKWYDSSLSSSEQVIVKEGRPDKVKATIQQTIVEGKVVKKQIIKTETIAHGEHGMMKTGDSQANVLGWVSHMYATAYHPADGNGDGITATGTKAGYGTIAVDPAVIPLGSKVYVPNYGDAVAADTGGAIKGNRVDLCMENYSECFDFGVRYVDVFVHY
ncbi:hypothetical protein BCB69_03235 [Dialister pneumosintes]|jgi:Uncharacterized protein conserved in bacteria|uniref:G5 domain-containing protein n=1 Tax=Dialister pneumosintes TaxID=39950 RepID=A0A1B3WDM4_9FIRM|nr:hypothetical protein BCB69_03235 [Dialister pneumosintes]